MKIDRNCCIYIRDHGLLFHLIKIGNRFGNKTKYNLLSLKKFGYETAATEYCF